MKRVVVFQGLGVAAPNVPLPDGVWQRGKPTPAVNTAMWYRTQQIADQSTFPPAGGSPANCRMCPPGDDSPDCCESNTTMPQYVDYGMMAYESSFKPWNQDSQVYEEPPSTTEIVAHAMNESLRQAKLEMASPADAGPTDPSQQLSGFIASSGRGLGYAGQTRLLGLGYAGQTRLLGVGDCGCNAKLSGIFTGDDGSLNTTGYVAIGVGVTAAAGVLYMMLRKKKRR